MPKLNSYSEMSIRRLRATREPNEIAQYACDMTMKAKPKAFQGSANMTRVLEFLVKAEHTSVLEHCSITFAVGGVSRSLLAQLSRHRMASITSQSQHYQDYRDMPLALDADLLADPYLTDWVDGVTRYAQEAYIALREQNVPKEEARQVLLNAATVNIIWTANARGLINFFRQRLCYRNVKEMKIFADRIYSEAMIWWPELFQFVGPPCFRGTCNQGVMQAERCKKHKGIYQGAYNGD